MINSSINTVHFTYCYCKGNRDKLSISSSELNNKNMSDSFKFGIIPSIETDKNYLPDGSVAFKTICRKYHCVSVPDDIVNNWIPLIDRIPTFLFSINRESFGIDHYAVTLIPPNSVKLFLEVILSYLEIDQNKSIQKLIRLLNAAIDNNKYVICFGI